MAETANASDNIHGARKRYATDAEMAAAETAALEVPEARMREVLEIMGAPEGAYAPAAVGFRAALYRAMVGGWDDKIHEAAFGASIERRMSAVAVFAVGNPATMCAYTINQVRTAFGLGAMFDQKE